MDNTKIIDILSYVLLLSTVVLVGSMLVVLVGSNTTVKCSISGDTSNEGEEHG